MNEVDLLLCYCLFHYLLLFCLQNSKFLIWDSGTSKQRKQSSHPSLKSVPVIAQIKPVLEIINGVVKQWECGGKSKS